MKTEEQVLEYDSQGRVKPVQAKTGKRHLVNVKSPVLIIKRQYHDDSPVVEAPFAVEFADGTTLRGVLNKIGEARITHLKSDPLRIRFDEDARPYRLPKQNKNPEYLAEMTPADADALVKKAVLTFSTAPPKKKSIVFQVGDWVWGSLQGNFNDQQTTSQVIVDAVISCIPVVGEITDVRDLIAIILGMIEDPKKREDKWEWLGLVVILLALIPLAGGVLKGTGKLLISSGQTGAKATQTITDFIAFLNRSGWGKASQWFAKLDLEKYVPRLLGEWRRITGYLDAAFAALQRRFNRIMPGDLVVRLKRLREGVAAVAQKGESMIPDSIKELNTRLKSVQRNIYEGEWEAIPKTLKSETKELEARLIDLKTGGKKWAVDKKHFPPSNPDLDYHHVKSWPDLLEPPHARSLGDEKKIFQDIESFSGPIHAVELAPGTKIYRVVTNSSNRAGGCWSYHLPETGKLWREDSAVLERWSENGYYVEFTVPEEGLKVWEGKIASQLDDTNQIPMGKGKQAGSRLNKSEGQYLAGGGYQIIVDFKHQSNRHAWQSARNAPLMPTNWKKSDLIGIGVPEKAAVAQKLGPLEREAKVPAGFLNEFEKQGGRLKTGKDMHESRQREKAKEEK